MSVSAFAVMTHATISTLSTGAMDEFHATPTAYGYVLLMGLFGTVAPALLLNSAIGRIGAARTAILGTTGPVATSLLAVIVLGEPFTIYHLLALVLSITGVSLIVKTSKS